MGLGSAIKKAAKQATKAVSKAVSQVGDVETSVYHATEKAVQQTGSAIEKSAEQTKTNVKHAIEEAKANPVGAVLGLATGGIAGAALGVGTEKVGKKAAEQLGDLGTNIYHGAEKVGKTIEKGATAALGFVGTVFGDSGKDSTAAALNKLADQAAKDALENRRKSLLSAKQTMTKRVGQSYSQIAGGYYDSETGSIKLG